MPARLVPAGWAFASDFNWSSSAIAQGNETETLIVDAETRELRFAAARGFGGRFAFQLQIPYRYTGAGALDGFIDGWHDAFGLPEGARRALPEDELRIIYERDGTRSLNRRSSISGFGNVTADLGYQLIDTPGRSLAGWLSAKLPSGDTDRFVNSGVDLSLTMAGERRLNDRWSVFGQLGATYLSDSDVLTQQRHIVWSGLAGIGARTWRNLQLKLQVDAHTAVFDNTRLDFLGDAAILTVGGSYELDSGWLIDIGVSEDIAVEASPDVVFVFGIRRAY
jgi:hypothetical protein